APRYNNKPMETGPLATVLASYAKGQPECKALVDTVLKHLNVGPEALFSTLGRTAARGIECAVIAAKTETWLNQLETNVKKGDTNLCAEWKMPKEAEGVGFVDACRGSLSHWISIKNGKIDNYQLVVPSTWNLGPRDAAGKLGPVEEALIGTPVADPKRPVEVLRTVHSFDPCIACGVHIIDPQTNEVYEFKVR
ncbi:MAG: nickel-dependent hydrogenase large subunit, partial [Deltaproteobacteria bacterium]|nr:nickel-dependent hydrogenase large subunit [Deltaproteobacteria bacterium]